MVERTAVGLATRSAVTVLGVALVLLGQFCCGPAGRAAATLPDPRCYSAYDAPDGSLGKVASKAPAGVYLWLDAAAWHIRVTDADPGATFTGEISACHAVQVATYLTTTADQLYASPSTDAVVFTLTPGGQLDGFEFNATCPTTWTFSFQLDGAPVAPDQITVGALGVHPDSSTFALPSCPESGVDPFGVRTSSIPPGDSGELTSSGLQTVPALTLAAVTAAWPQLDLPARTRRVYGGPAVAATAPIRDGSGLSLLGSLGLAGEIGLGIVLLAVWFTTRRQRRAAR